MKKTIIPENTTLKGDLSLKGGIILSGRMNGNINTPGKVIISSTGSLNGNVSSEFLENSGVIEGDVVCGRAALLMNGSRVNGKITTSSIIVQEYADHIGELQMSWKK